LSSPGSSSAPPAAADPAPRRYPAQVALMRRSDRGPSAAPDIRTVDDLAAWLLGPALATDDLLTLAESLFWGLAAAGLPLDRASLHVGTLHPQVFAFAWNWRRDDGLCDEVRVAEGMRGSDSYRRNPLFAVIERGERFQARLDEPGAAERSPLMAELAGQGIVEYLALPLVAGGAYHNAMTLATARTGGFDAADRAAMDRLLPLFALHVERHIALRIARNLLDTYLGPLAGGRVLEGTIKRGSGRRIAAVIWASDLRGFTTLSDALDGADVTALLDAWFERQVAAIAAGGGEVLKFIGDGLLAVFPTDGAGPEAAAAAALEAARGAMAALDALNDAPPPDLARIAEWRPLRAGIALHEGEVFFGNVGAAERLDFTVIGRAVNEAARVETLTKTLGRPILVTDPVARHLPPEALEPLGEHALRGVGRPMALFAPVS